MGVITERRSYVAGRWVEGDEVLAVENPADESQAAELSATPIAEFGRAIAEARQAFDEGPWPTMPVAERARVLHALIDHIEANGESLVATMMAEAGQPTMFAEAVQLRSGAVFARDTIDLYLSMAHEDFNPVPVDQLVTGRVA
ncbi:MAG TPA: aldehyde dehydrogenase family protein, partial [Acidimicrobiia bacterium]|nr:aldehyde dehydrogenase family protein [Acidimicrobiia bacterium]